jgi:hypothetical protein
MVADKDDAPEAFGIDLADDLVAYLIELVPPAPRRPRAAEPEEEEPDAKPPAEPDAA